MEALLSLISDGHNILASEENANNKMLGAFVNNAAVALQNIKCCNWSRLKPNTVKQMEAIACLF